MTKRRTRKDKMEARHEYSYTLDVTQSASSPTNQPSPHFSKNPTVPLLLTERHYVLSDLAKTAIFSLMMIMIEFAVYRYWNL